MSKNPNIVQIDSVTFRCRRYGPQSSDVIAERAVMPTPVSFPLSYHPVQIIKIMFWNDEWRYGNHPKIELRSSQLCIVSRSTLCE